MAGLFESGGAESSIQQYKFRPQDRQMLDQLMGTMNYNVGNANRAASNASAATLTDFAKFDPKLNEWKGLDAYSQQQVSQGQQLIAQKQGTQAAGIQRQFGQANPGLANILGFQNRFAGANAGNGLGFAAATAQQGRHLAQSQQASNLQQLANAAQGQKAQLGQQGLNNSILGLGAGLAAGVAGGEKQALALEDAEKMKAEKMKNPPRQKVLIPNGLGGYIQV